MKKTVVLGASENPERYSNRAVRALDRAGNTVIAIGNRIGKIGNIDIQKGQPEISAVDTVTLYLSQKNQTLYYDYIIRLKPKRIIYNPGAENPELEKLAEENGIEN